MRNRLGSKLAGAMLAAMALIGINFFTATPGSAAAAPAQVSAATSVMSNNCNYPTSARPGSTFVESYGNCNTCRASELLLQNRFFWRDYYCTYNPSNDMNDLHYQ